MSKFMFEKNVSGIVGLTMITSTLFADSRGYFMESYNENEFEEQGLCIHFVQDNQSLSKKGVLRGLHFQRQYPQAKLIRAASGSFYSVVVDLRKGSKTFGQWYGTFLSDKNKKQIFVPAGLAHGFLVLEDNTIFAAKVTDYQYKEFADGLIWNDPDLGIKWPLDLLDGVEIIQSEADKNRMKLAELIINKRLPI